MGRKQKYSNEFRESAVAMVLKQGFSVEKAAADLSMSANTLRVWTSLARKGKGVFAPKEEKDLLAKVRELEAENRRLKMERDILKKATALFAQLDGGRA
jgi:transposase